MTLYNRSGTYTVFDTFCMMCAPAGWAARFGSGLFLVIQMIILLDFTQSWNDTWVKNGEDDDRWLYGLLSLTVACFLGVLGISGWPHLAGSCLAGPPPSIRTLV